MIFILSIVLLLILEIYSENIKHLIIDEYRELIFT